MTIHRLKLSERDHMRAERLISPGRGVETETPIGHLSVSVHGQVYVRTPTQTVPLTVTEAVKVIAELNRLVGTARNQLRIRAGVANDCEPVRRKSRLWRKVGGALKKARKW